MDRDSSGEFPKLEVSTHNLDFGHLDQGQSDQAIVTLVITNTGTGVLAGRLYPQVTWLSITPQSFRLLNEQSSNHQILLGPKVPQHWNLDHYQNDFLILINSNGGSASIGGTYIIQENNQSNVIQKRPKTTAWVAVPILLAVLLIILILRIFFTYIIPTATAPPISPALFTQAASTIAAALTDEKKLSGSRTTLTPFLKRSVLTTLVFTPTPQYTPTYTPWPRQSYPNPEQLIRDYYNALNHQQYDEAWSMLSPGFQDACCNIGGNPPFVIYTGWWDAIEKVEVLSAYLQKWDENPAQVYVSLRFHPRKGEPYEAFYVFKVIADSDRKSLLIDQVK